MVVTVDTILRDSLAQGPLNVTSYHQNSHSTIRVVCFLQTQSKGGEFKKKQKEEKWKRKKRKKVEEKCEAQKEELVEKSAKKGSPASLRRRGKKKRQKRKAGGVTDIPERDKPWENREDGSFSLCCWSRTGFVSLEDGSFSFCYFGRMVVR